MSETKERNLGARRDFWNTKFNPITGFRVPPSYHTDGNRAVNIPNLIAEY